jgi:acetyl-CoA carboxylase biotin carboxyl carrier protein
MDTKEILDLFEKFESSSLSEIAIKKGDVEVMMKKGGVEKAAVYVEHHSPAAGPAQPQHIVQHAAAPDKPALKQDGNDIIASPMVGTFYRAPAPDAPPFVDVGAKVKKGQTICILEAMKLMNELEVEFDCEIVKILVENGKMVEFGTPLFEVKKT